MKQHTHKEWLKFLRLIDDQPPAGEELHLIADNSAAPKHPDVHAWLQQHPRFHMPCTADQCIVD